MVATRARETMCAVNVSVEAVIASGPETLRSSQVGDAAATAAPAAGREARAVAMAATLGATDPFESSARRTRAPRRGAPGGRFAAAVAIWSREDPVPLAEDQIAGHHHRATLVALGEQREQHLGFVGALLHVAQIVE